jgi:hypothetical protein
VFAIDDQHNTVWRSIRHSVANDPEEKGKFALGFDHGTAVEASAASVGSSWRAGQVPTAPHAFLFRHAIVGTREVAADDVRAWTARLALTFPKDTQDFRGQQCGFSLWFAGNEPPDARLEIESLADVRTRRTGDGRLALEGRFEVLPGTSGFPAGKGYLVALLPIASRRGTRD